MRARLVVAAAAAILAGCRGDQGPVSGELSVRLVTPHAGDRAALFVVTGKLHGVSAPSGGGYRVFADTSVGGDTARVVVVAAPGRGLVAGEIARIRVDDTRRFGSYAARLIGLAAANYQLSDPSGVSLSVAKP